MNIKIPQQEQEDIHERIQRELKEETKREVEEEDRRNGKQAYSMLFLLFSVFFFIIYIGNTDIIPGFVAIIVLLGDILSLRGLGIF